MTDLRLLDRRGIRRIFGWVRVDGFGKVLPGVGLQRVVRTWISDAQVGQPVGLHGFGRLQEEPEPLAYHGPQGDAAGARVEPGPREELVGDIDGGRHCPTLAGSIDMGKPSCGRVLINAGSRQLEVTRRESRVSDAPSILFGHVRTR